MRCIDTGMVCRCGNPKYKYAKQCRNCSARYATRNHHKGEPRPDHVRERIRASLPRGERHHAWKSDVSRQTGRSRAQSLYTELRPCAICGAENTERHHKDGDTFNNATDNIAFLCKRHHHQIHPGNGHMPLRNYDVMVAYLAQWKYSPWRDMKRRYEYIARQLTPVFSEAVA